MRVCGAGLVLGRVEWEAGSHRAGLDGVHPFRAFTCQGGGCGSGQRWMVLEKSPTPLRWREETKAPNYFATLDCGAPVQVRPHCPRLALGRVQGKAAPWVQAIGVTMTLLVSWAHTRVA